MSKLRYIPEQRIFPNSVAIPDPPNPSAGNIKIFRKDDGLWYEKDDSSERIVNIQAFGTYIYSKPAIVTHLNATNNTFTNAFTQSITIPFTGVDYLMTITFNYNVDANTSDLVVRATFGGAALDLNDRNADPQGQFQILRAEVKDSANSPGGAITGTGSGQKYCYSSQFVLQSPTTSDLVIDVGAETGNVEGSIWNIIVKLEAINLVNII